MADTLVPTLQSARKSRLVAISTDLLMDGETPQNVIGAATTAVLAWSAMNGDEAAMAMAQRVIVATNKEITDG